MLATLVLAAALPLGLWPVDAGAAATVIDDVEFYLVERRQQDHRVDAESPGQPRERPQSGLVDAFERRCEHADGDDPVIVLGLAGVELDLVDQRDRRTDLFRPHPERQRRGEQQGGEHDRLLTPRASATRRRRGTAAAPAG